MGKVSRFSDDLMVEAVENYAKQFPGKIIVTRLAKWSSDNFEGLEGVTRKDFERKRTIKSEKTGKKELADRPAMLRIREINDLRSVTEKIKRNTLLQSSRLNAYFELPGNIQRQLILDTRAQFDAITEKNVQLLRRNKLLEEENKLLREENERLQHEQDKLRKECILIEEKIDHAIRSADEEMRRQVLASFGVSNEGYFMTKYKKTLKLTEEASFDKATSQISSEMKLVEDDTDILLYVIDFDGGM